MSEKDKELEAFRKKAPSFSCPLCDSDVPAEVDTEPGNVLYCSYCKMELRVRLAPTTGKLTLEAEDEE